MNSMYDVFMQLPIFQGVGKDKLTELLEKNRFHFLKFRAGERIVSKGDECLQIKFLISGSVRLEMLNKNGKIKITEVVTAPDVLSPYHMFGRNTSNPCDVYAQTEVGIMQIDKQAFFSIMQNEPIFMLNLLNIVSLRAQKTLESFLSLSSGDMREKFALWVLCCTQQKATEIRIHCKHTDLYSIFGVQRSVFIYALEQLKSDGIVDYSPREIAILDRRKLKEVLTLDSYESMLAAL